MTLTRQQTLAILSALLLAALIGLALFLAMQAIRADEILAQTALSAGRGEMSISDVMSAMSAGSEAAHTFLSK
jgi:hypothetical protein